MKFKNFSDLKTTLPTIIASVISVLVVTGVLDDTVAQELQTALLGLSGAALTIIGLFSKGE